MDPIETATGLSAFAGRAPGTDSERRAARWLAAGLREQGRDAVTETVWVRPHWSAVAALHTMLGVAGSLLAAELPIPGLCVLAVTFVSALLDANGRLYLVRRLTPRRATQNVYSPAPAARPGRLIITAPYAAGRAGLIYRAGPARFAARLERAARGRIPGPHFGLVATLGALVALAGLRVGGIHPFGLSVAQFALTLPLVMAAALLIDILLSDTTPGANDPGSAAGVALALAAALDAAPPRALGVEVVLAGASEGGAAGFRAHLRARRHALDPATTVILSIAACGRGRPAVWVADGPLLALALHPRLVELAEETARAAPGLGARPHRGHSASAVYGARARRLPAIAIGARDERGTVPGSHDPADLPDRLDPAVTRATLELCLGLVERLDAELAARL